MTKKLLLSLLAIIVGMITISVLSEFIEMLVVSLSSNKTITELMDNQGEYFEIRNRSINVVLKIIYNTAASFIGAWFCLLIAKRKPMRHAILLTALQTLGFVYGMSLSEYSNTTPIWLWIVLILVSAAGILMAAYLKMRRASFTLIHSTDDKIKPNVQ